MAKSKKVGNKRQQECKKISKQRAKRLWWQAARNRTSWLVAILISIYAITSIAWFSYNGGIQRSIANLQQTTYALSAKAGFRVEFIYLEGRRETPREDIDKILADKNGKPILAVSVSDLKEELEAIPQVHIAQVERVFPNQLHIRIDERSPIAIWQHQGEFQLIDAEGKVMPESHNSKYGKLPQVVGEDAPLHAAKLLDILKQEPELAQRMQAAIRIGERRWNIRFDNGIELKLPEEKVDIAWRKFALMNKEKELLSRAIKSVDMRLPDRIFIQRVPGTEPAKDDPNAKET